MSAGQLQHLVTLQTQSDTQDELGQPVVAWTTTAAVWADIRYQTGLSAIKSGTDVSVVRVSIRMRYRAVNAGQRIVFEGTVFSIESVQPDVRRTYVDCVAEVINAAS